MLEAITNMVVYILSIKVKPLSVGVFILISVGLGSVREPKNQTPGQKSNKAGHETARKSEPAREPDPEPLDDLSQF